MSPNTNLQVIFYYEEKPVLAEEWLTIKENSGIEIKARQHVVQRSRQIKRNIVKVTNMDEERVRYQVPNGDVSMS